MEITPPSILGPLKIELILDDFQGTSAAIPCNGGDTIRPAERIALVPIARIL